MDGSRTLPLVTFTPHPNPPPPRGEGRVGVNPIILNWLSGEMGEEQYPL
jgi:hypothetical protein